MLPPNRRANPSAPFHSENQWLGTFPIGRDWGNKTANDLAAACKGIEPCISVHVFGYKSIKSMARLLTILQTSDYTGYDSPLPLVIHLDGPVSGDHRHISASIRQLVEDFEWTHGPKILDIHHLNRGLKASWLSAWTSPKPEDVMLAFEDGTLLSRWYFQWILKVLKQYNLLGGSSRDSSLLGVSLSSLHVDQMIYPFSRRIIHDTIPEKFPIFLHSVPSFCGAVYFGRPWREFLDFVAMRDAPPFYAENEDAPNFSSSNNWYSNRGDPNLLLPGSGSNNWGQSWKRFIVEFAYGRGAYMIYPNYVDSSGLAASASMQATHVPEQNSRNRRRRVIVQAAELNLEDPLPSYSSLPVVDMHGKESSRWNVSRQGDRFLNTISRLGEHYSALTRHWQRACILDEAGPRTMDEVWMQHNKSTNRYLVVAPQMGFSNQLIATMNSAVWAYILGRTLVLPFILWPRALRAHANGGNWVSFHEIFDPTGVVEHLRGLDFVYGDFTMMTGWQPRRIAIIEPQPIFDSLHDSYLRAFGWDKASNVDIISYRSRLNSSDGVYQLFGSCQDKILILNGLYKNPQTDNVTGVDTRLLWASLFRPTPMVYYMINKIIDEISGRSSEELGNVPSTYGCLHIRRGDFAAVCASAPGVAPWLAELYQRGRRCQVSLAAIVTKATYLNVDKLLVISDDTTIFSDLLHSISGISVMTSQDIRSFVGQALLQIRPHPIEELVDVVSAVTEQHVCAKADRIVLNEFSTFSRSISYIRESPTGIEYW